MENWKTKVFRVKAPASEDLVFGIYLLCEYLGYQPNKLIQNITVEEIVKWLCNNPNITVTQLDKPLKLD